MRLRTRPPLLTTYLLTFVYREGVRACIAGIAYIIRNTKCSVAADSCSKDFKNH